MSKFESNGGDKKRVPLRFLLIFPFIAEIGIFALLVGFISFRNGESIVKELVTVLSAEISGRIESQLRIFLGTPLRLNGITAEFVRDGILNPRDQEAMQRYFLHVVRQNPSITSIYFGNTAGGIAGAGREGAEESFYVTGSPGFEKGAFRKHAADSDGNPGRLLVDVPSFDVRSRPWYRNAVDERGPVWSGPYALTTGQDMALALSLPVYDRAMNLVGVVSVDLFLSHLSSFFSSLEFGKTGVGFILDRTGRLITSSFGSRGIKDGIGSAAVDSSVPEIRTAASFLSGFPGGLGSFDDGFHADLVSENRNFFLFVSPLRIPHGFDWLSVMMIPKSDYMGQIDASLRSTVLLVFAALLVTAGVGIITSKIILRPLTVLAARTRTLSVGDWNGPESPSRIEEIDELNSAFNRMSERLKKSHEKLHSEIEERKNIQHALREYKDRLDLALKGADLGTWDLDIESKEMLFNDRYAEMLGYSPGELEENFDIWNGLICPEDADRVIGLLVAHLEGESPHYEAEYRLRSKSGEWIWVLDKGKVTHRDGAGTPLRVVGTHLDITARKKTEEALHELLEAKDVLMKELQHRVKNNLTMIDSILYMESQTMKDEKALAVLKDTQSRIRSMAGVYEILYKSSGGDKVDCGQYVRSIVEYLSRTFLPDDGRIDFSVRLDEIRIDLKNAVPLGLVVNELVTNSLKYAFPDGVEGRIEIDLKIMDEGWVELRVADDGAGFPEGFDLHKTSGLGLSLVLLLAKQLRGSVTAGRNELRGAFVLLRFRPGEAFSDYGIPTVKTAS